MLGEVGENWLYGQGVGETAATAGAIAVFPPYALWVLGNAALSVGGYRPLEFSDVLPEAEKQAWSDTYDSITSSPGRATAAVAGTEFRSKGVAKEKLKPYLGYRAADGRWVCPDGAAAGPTKAK